MLIPSTFVCLCPGLRGEGVATLRVGQVGDGVGVTCRGMAQSGGNQLVRHALDLTSAALDLVEEVVEHLHRVGVGHQLGSAVVERRGRVAQAHVLSALSGRSRCPPRCSRRHSIAAVTKAAPRGFAPASQALSRSRSNSGPAAKYSAIPYSPACSSASAICSSHQRAQSCSCEVSNRSRMIRSACSRV